MNFKFYLQDRVVIVLTDTPAEVIGRADYANSTPNNYFLFYKDSSNNPCKAWFDENDLALLKIID